MHFCHLICYFFDVEVAWDPNELYINSVVIYLYAILSLVVYVGKVIFVFDVINMSEYVCAYSSVGKLHFLNYMKGFENRVWFCNLYCNIYEISRLIMHMHCLLVKVFCNSVLIFDRQLYVLLFFLKKHCSGMIKYIFSMYQVICMFMIFSINLLIINI